MPGSRQGGLYSEDVLVPAGAKNSSSDSGIWDGFGQCDTMRLFLNVTSITGTGPGLAVFVEDTLDGTNWNQLVAFTAKAATGTEVKDVTTPFANRIRIRWALTGTGGPTSNFIVVAASETPQT